MLNSTPIAYTKVLGYKKLDTRLAKRHGHGKKGHTIVLDVSLPDQYTVRGK